MRNFRTDADIQTSATTIANEIVDVGKELKAPWRALVSRRPILQKRPSIVTAQGNFGRKELILRLFVAVILCVSPTLSGAAQETIGGFRLNTCSPDGTRCLRLLANRATRGFLAKFYLLEGDLHLALMSHSGAGQTRETLLTGVTAFYDADQGTLMLRRSEGDVLVDLQNVRASFFRPFRMRD